MSPPTPPPLRVALLACVTRRAEQSVLPGSPLTRARRLFRHARNSVRWSLLSDFRFHYWDYLHHVASNAGDSAIREATRQQIAALFHPRPVEFVEASWGEADPHLAARLNRDCHLLVWCAGAVAHLAPDGSLAPYFTRYARFLNALSIPAFAYGLGISTKLGFAQQASAPIAPEAARLLAAFTASFALCGVRDSGSHQLLTGLHAGIPEPRLISDPTLFFSSAAAPRIPPGPCNIGVNFAFHGSHCQSLTRRYFPVYLESLRLLESQLPGCRFYYFVHAESEMLLVRLLRRARIDLEVVSGSPEQLLADYRSLHLHLGQMLHSCILAANAGVPMVALAYDSKHLAFLHSLGMQQSCLLPAQWTPATIVEAIARLAADRPRFAGQIRGAVESMRVRQDAFLQELHAVFSS